MMGQGLFMAQLATVEQILGQLGLLEERQIFPNKTLGASNFRGKATEQYTKPAFVNTPTTSGFRTNPCSSLSPMTGPRTAAI